MTNKNRRNELNAWNVGLPKNTEKRPDVPRRRQPTIWMLNSLEVWNKRNLSSFVQVVQCFVYTRLIDSWIAYHRVSVEVESGQYERQ